MPSDFTQIQGGEDLERSLRLSRQRGTPPCEVPGYEPRRFLGAGAYGEVWVAIDRTTGRQVAIKFYLHRGGLDWSLLAHEVEKLVFLSADRYVVQLLDVGWDSEPPYYVMEYIENGSLDERLQRETRLNAAQATALFREIAVGLMHSHGKGVLHCDLKPANILLDQDGKPRLADFGQSRLTHEQTPALGTLFYMAPEQANPKAVPDARWDVYALGAIFYVMLTGHPPHRHEKSVTEIESAPHLEGRLERYRRLIERAPPPAEHRKIHGVDKRLAGIINRCLAADPRQRFPTVQTVLAALDARERHRSRRPLVVLGALGPMLLLAVMAVGAWLWFNTSLNHTSEALTESALQGLKFASRGVAISASKELEDRFWDVEEVADDSELVTALATLEDDAKSSAILKGLADPEEIKKRQNELIDDLSNFPQLKLLRDRLAYFDKIMVSKNTKSASWFITDAHGVQIARWYERPQTFGHCYAWRTYFSGLGVDKPEDWRPGPNEHLQKTEVSAAYLSSSSDVWSVAISSPIFRKDKDGKKLEFLGVVSVSFPMGRELVALPSSTGHFAVLVYAPEGEPFGTIYHHPLLEKQTATEKKFPERFVNDPKYGISQDLLGKLREGVADYSDPIGKDEGGAEYRKRFLAVQSPIEIRGEKTRWDVVVEAPYELSIGATLHQLSDSLVATGIVALVLFGLVIFGLWWLVVRMLDEPTSWPAKKAIPKNAAAETLPFAADNT